MENSKKLLRNSTSLKRKTKPGTQTLLHPLSVQLNDFLTAHLSFHDSESSHLTPALLLALSGGLDSVVLLHLLVHARKTLPFKLHAMHVHHGLSPNADAWATFCQTQCTQLDVPLQIMHVHVAKNPDYKNSEQGIEAEARELRYQALLNGGVDGQLADFVVTAHHQDDQAETLLLQLFRGAGVRGLAAMPGVDATRKLLRPLLQQSRLSLESYARLQSLQWCEDESNDSIEYERNFVRHEVVPVLEARYPSLKNVLTRTAMHMAEADALLKDLAQLDALSVLADNTLCLKGLAQLSVPRIKNILRWWFAENGLSMPTAEYLQEIVEQLLYAKKDADLNLPLQHLILRKYQARAYLCEDKPAHAFNLVWNGEASLHLPSGGKLLFNQVSGKGLKLKLGMTKLRISNRDGGERFKPNPLRPTRTLKYLLQEIGMPPWKRQYLPLVYWEDKLASVPGVGIAYGLEAAADEAGLEIIWQE